MDYGRLYNKQKNVSITPLDIYNLYPVGSIYISVINTNPSTYFGGTWEAFGTGRCLVGVDTSQVEFNTVLKTGGEKTHKLTVNEMPKHNHPIYYGVDGASPGNTLTASSNAIGQSNAPITDRGGSQAHNNLQPYITVYMWRRIS